MIRLPESYIPDTLYDGCYLKMLDPCTIAEVEKYRNIALGIKMDLYHST